MRASADQSQHACSVKKSNKLSHMQVRCSLHLHIVRGKDHTAGLACFTWIVTSFWTSIPRSSSPGFQGEGSLCWLVMVVWTGSGPLTDEGSRSVISDAALSSSASCRVELVSLVYRALLGNRGALSPGSSWPGITKLKRRLVILVSP
jgi:hypothetical protein